MNKTMRNEHLVPIMKITFDLDVNTPGIMKHKSRLETILNNAFIHFFLSYILGAFEQHACLKCEWQLKATFFSCICLNYLWRHHALNFD